MPNLFIEILGAIGAISLLISPGLLVLIAFPGAPVAARIMLPAAFMLSPGVVAAELAGSAIAGVPFAVFAPAASLLNLAAVGILLLYRRPRIVLDVPIAWLVTPLLVVITLLAFLEAEPLRREYGYHNMMQLSAIQGIYALPRPPEELGLAGTNLNYGWLGWAQIAAIAKLTQTAPTLLFFPLNAAHFVCLFIVMCEASTAFRAGSRTAGGAAIAISTGIALMSTGLPDIVRNLFDHTRWPHGDLRITPMFSKYLNMDLMVFGLSAMGIMIYAMIRAAQSRDVNTARLMAISGLGASLTYPLFLPSVVAIGAAFLGFAAVASWLRGWDVPRYTRGQLAGIVAVWLACLVFASAYLAFMSKDTTAAPLTLWPLAGVLLQIKKLGWIFLVIDVLLIFVTYQAWRTRSGVLMLLVLISCGLQLAFLIFSMPLFVEYKFLFAALIVAVPATSAILSKLADTGAPRRLAAAAAFAATFAGCLTFLPQWHQPHPILNLAEPFDEGSSEIRPSQGWATSWLRAVREQTPDDTILLTGPSRRPDAVFTGRAIYVCADLRVGNSVRVGYSMTCRDELQSVKGYSSEEISRRLTVLDMALAENVTAAQAGGLIEALKRLGRPIALHTADGSAFRTWLEEHGIGRPIFVAGNESVWLIDRNEFPSAAALANAQQ